MATYDDATVLTLGTRGRDFVLIGRTCVRGRRGAIWNEWTVRYDDGRTGFLAESGDAFVVYEEGSLVPELSVLVVGAPIDTGYLVVERGEATRVAQWGEVDAAPSRYAYVDLSKRDGTSATLDFGDGSTPGSPRLFVGRSVTLDELGLTARPSRSFVPAPNVSRPSGVETWLEVGDEGELEGASFRVTGIVSRRAGEGAWDEYLLHHPRRGLRWLVLAEGHWSIARPIPAGPVDEAAMTAAEEAIASVVWATGELPWDVAIGDRSHVRDFASSDATFTKEWTADEVSWSRSTPVATDVIAKAFGKRALPKPR